METADRILQLEATVARLSGERKRHGWRTRWAAVGAAVAITVGGSGTALHYASAAPGDVVANSFVPVSPVRILDTRPAPENVGGFVGPLGSGQTHSFQVTGLNGVPANATAVVMNVAVDGTTGSSYLSVFPAGTAAPLVANLNWSPGTTISNLTTVKIGAGGQVSVLNYSGNAQVIADLAGYYVPGNDKFVALDVLGRVPDSATRYIGAGAAAGLGFDKVLSNEAGFNVVLPPDYTPGSAIIGKFTWHTSSTSCAVNWMPGAVSVSRAGQLHNVGGSPSAGMSGPGVVTAGETANLVQSATFTLQSPNPADTLRPGDSYTFRLIRAGNIASDTCNREALVDSMVITYE